MTESRHSSPQFTLRHLIVMVTLFALAMIAITQSSHFWLSLLATITLIIFLTAIVAALFSQRNARAYWVGFSVWGLAYLILIGLILKNENDGSGKLVTTKILKYVHSAVVREVPVKPPPAVQFGGGGFNGGGVGFGGGGGGFGGGGGGLGGGIGGGAFGVPTTYVPAHSVFMPVGQLMWSWLFAVLGGYVAQWCFRHSAGTVDAAGVSPAKNVSTEHLG